MKKIELDTYKLYCKYNGQAIWEEGRTTKPKGVSESIGKDFGIIASISDNLYRIKSGHYSNKLEGEMEEEISKLKAKLTDEVFGYLMRDEKIYPDPKKNFIKRLFNK